MFLEKQFDVYSTVSVTMACGQMSRNWEVITAMKHVGVAAVMPQEAGPNL